VCRAPRGALKQTKSINGNKAMDGSDRSRFAKCSDAPIDFCQIGRVTMPIRIISLLHLLPPPSPLPFSFIGHRSDKRLSANEKRFGHTFCLALRASASLRPHKEVTAIEQSTQVELWVTYLSLRFAKLVLLSFGLVLFAAAFFCAFWRSVSL
jgi:hypothetical protein